MAEKTKFKKSEKKIHSFKRRMVQKGSKLKKIKRMEHGTELVNWSIINNICHLLRSVSGELLQILIKSIHESHTFYLRQYSTAIIVA